MRSQNPNPALRHRNRHRSGIQRVSRQASNEQVAPGLRLRMPSLADRVTRLRLRWRSTTLSNIGAGFLLASLLGIAGVAGASPANAPTAPTIPHYPPLSAPATAPAPTTTLVRTSPDAHCSQWWQLATESGWDTEDLARLDLLLWRESRCDPSQHNPADPNGGSYGLMQINGFWCLPSRYYPAGYLQTLGILQTCTDLYEPSVAFTAGLAIYSYSVEENGCGWKPWATMTCP